MNKPALMTSQHYRKWHAERGKERKEKIKRQLTRSVLVGIVICAFLTIGMASYLSYRVTSAAAETMSGLIDDFNPTQLTVTPHTENPDIDFIVVSGPRAVGMTKEVRVLEGHGYKVIRNFHAGV